MTYYVDGAATPEFADACVKLAEVLGTKVTEEQIRLHAQLFSGVSWDDLMRGFGRAARELDKGFYPPPGAILRFVRANEDDAALLAWTTLGQAVSSSGAWQDVFVEDAAAAHALLTVFGSWSEFCRTDEGPGLALKRQEFMAAYRQFSRSPRVPATGPVRLPGCADPRDASGVVWSGLIARTGVTAVRYGELPEHTRNALGNGR